MEDRISLRPMSGTNRLGPSTDFFAAFRSGAGKHLRSTNRDNQWDSKASKRPEDRIRYSRDFLEKLKEGFRDLPTAVNPNISCFTSSEESWTKPEREGGVSEAEDKTLEETTDSTWRSRPQTSDRPVVTEQSAIPAPLPADSSKVNQLQKAEELGREAYRPRAAQNISDDEKNIRQVKGILNKLTPNNFDRLVTQITELVTNAEVLRKSISLVFEKAVAEPTFCALYAELCERLSTQVQDFPPLEGEKQKLTFRRILLNTCQDEFEGVENSRQSLESVEDEVERELTEKKVKDRTLGNMRLISELFNKDLLQTTNEVEVPHEDNLEAVCEVLTLAGKKIAQNQKYEMNLQAYLTRLDRFSRNKNLSSRISFLIKDVLDIQKNDWIPRREKFTAKKIEEIHAEAATELGIQFKMALPRAVAPAAAIMDDAELFPTPQRFNKEGEWKAVTDRLSKGATPAPVAAPVKPAPAKKKEFKTAEERQKYSESMFKEYLSSADKKEACLCAEEVCLSTEDSAIDLVSTGLQVMFDSVAEREHLMITELLIWLCSEAKVFSKEAFHMGLKSVTDQLDDLSLDIPKSPELCGKVLGKGIVEQVTEIEALPDLCSSILGAEARRPFAVGVFASMKEGGLDVVEICKKKNLHAADFLKAKEGFDVMDLESVESFLKRTDFSSLPL